MIRKGINLITKRYANFCRGDVHSDAKLYTHEYNIVIKGITRLRIPETEL